MTDFALTRKGDTGGEKESYSTDNQGRLVRTRSWVVDEQNVPGIDFSGFLANSEPSDLRGLTPNEINAISGRQAQIANMTSGLAQNLLGIQDRERSFQASRSDEMFSRLMREQAANLAERKYSASREDEMFDRKMANLGHNLAQGRFDLAQRQWNDLAGMRAAQLSRTQTAANMDKLGLQYLTGALTGGDQYGTPEETESYRKAFMSKLTGMDSLEKLRLRLQMGAAIDPADRLRMEKEATRSADILAQNPEHESNAFHAEMVHNFGSESSPYYWAPEATKGRAGFLGMFKKEPGQKWSKQKLPKIVGKSGAQQMTIGLIRDYMAKNPGMTFEAAMVSLIQKYIQQGYDVKFDEKGKK